MATIQKQFGTEIRRLRHKQNWSQEDLAAKLKLHRTYIGAIERGEKNLTIKNIEKVANCFGVRISDLFRGIGR